MGAGMLKTFPGADYGGGGLGFVGSRGTGFPLNDRPASPELCVRGGGLVPGCRFFGGAIHSDQGWFGELSISTFEKGN